jgi:hemolysin activation/secretion protein
VRFEVARFVVQGNTLLPPEEIESILAPYRGPNREFADVQRALEALQGAYAKRGYTMVRVALPEQELDRGIVRLQVVEARIGRVTVEGNHFFDDANIRASLPGLREGQIPNVARLSANLAQSNENPAKKTTMRMQSGPRDGEVDARLIVADEKPWAVGLNVDNTGSPVTGRTMVGVVYQNSNIANRDHVLGLQYTTTAEKPDQVSVYGAGYHVPIYSLGDSFDVYASYSDVNSGSVLTGIFELQVSGKGTIAGARYNHAFAHLGPVETSFSVGLEQKAYRNDVELSGFQLGNDITVRPVNLSYWGTWKSDASTTTFIVTGAVNIPGGRNGGDEDFARLRSGASANYSLARLTVAHAQSLPADWQLRGVLQAQYTRDALVPGEQFGAGGMLSVRGFESREIAGDKGISGNVELYTPGLCASISGVACRALVFGDAGRITRNDALAGEFEQSSIGSVGAGLRAQVGRYATAQIDVAHVLDGGPVSEKGSNRVHFRVSLTY